MYKPEGILPALVTPFTDDGKTVDEERLRALVEHCLKLGVDGVVIIGHGSSDSNAIKNAIRVAKEAVDGKVVELIRTGVQGESGAD